MPESPSMKAARRIQKEFPEIGTLYVPDIAAIIKSDVEQVVWDEAIEVVKDQAFRWRHTNQIVNALIAARDAKGGK